MTPERHGLGIADEMASAGDGTVWVLAAPIGYGKTSILNDLAITDGPVTWVVDDESALSAALEGATGGWVMVDDVEPDRPNGALATIAAWVDRPDSRIRLAVSTRNARIGQYLPMLKDGIHVFDQQDLRLTDDEAVQLLTDTGPAIDIDDVRATVNLCAGWAAALGAARRWATRHPGQSISDWLRGPGSEELLGHWFNELSGDQRNLLLDTAILECLDPDLCNAVRGSDESATLLIELESRHGFLHEESADDQGRAWWSRHPLLTLALRRWTRGRDVTAEHSRAAEYLMKNGDLDSAMDHLMAAGRLADAAQLLRDREDALMESGRAEVAQQWYERLGPDAVGPQIMHLLRMGWSRALAGDRRGAQATAEQLHSRLASPEAMDLTELSDPTGAGPSLSVLEVQGQAYLLTSYIASLTGDARETVVQARRAVDSFAGRFDHNSHQTAPTLVVRGLLWCGDVTGAQHELDRLSGQPFGSDMIRESVLAGVTAMTWVAQGHVHRALMRSEAADSWLSSQGLDGIELGQFAAPIARGQCLTDLGETEAARAVLVSVVTAAESRSMTAEQVYAMCALAKLQSYAGDLNNALATITKGRRALLATCPGSAMTARLNAVEAEVRILGGDLMRAERLVRMLPEGTSRSLLWARIAVLRQTSLAERALLGIAPTNVRQAATLELLFAAAALGRSTRLSEGYLMHAAELAYPEGMLMLLAAATPKLLALAETTAGRHGHDELAELVQRARDGVTTTTPQATKAPGLTGGAQVPLSRGEIALLPLLPSRDTNEQLAVTLGITVNTVKTRLRRLYRKLGVNSRDEAVAAARSRNLIR